MAVDRRPPLDARALRGLAFVVATAVALALLVTAARRMGDPASPLARFRATVQPPRVHVRGTLRALPGAELPALCIVRRQRLERCGKARCWVEVEGMTTAQASLDVAWSSAPLPSSLELSPRYRIEPTEPVAVPVEGARLEDWKARARKAGLAFPDASLASADERVVESCVEEGAAVFVEACFQDGGAPALEACAGRPTYGIVRGDAPQAAIDAAADDVAMRIGGGLFALLGGAIALVRAAPPLADALARRGGAARTRAAGWWLLAVLPLGAVVVNFFLHANGSPSTWATGRGGMILAGTALLGWLLLARTLLARHRRLEAALRPILTTERSPLARASGTVELAVRARRRGEGVAPVLGDDAVAFAEARVDETYTAGKKAPRLYRATVRPSDELEVEDESGTGVLHLANAVLDVEVRRSSFLEVPPRIAARGIELARHGNHLRYLVTEQVIADGEPLYVFGDVSAVALQAEGERGYRAVRGSPTLGGADAPPVLVYAGDERGLVASLAREARAARALAWFAACTAGLLSATILFLAWL